MTFDEAVKEMKVLAGDAYWSFDYTADSNGRRDIKGYIAMEGPLGHGRPSPTYAGAIQNVKAMLGLVPYDPAPEDGECH